ncbi:hypothetical protein GCM10009678_04980 [Actinomadura kijaniata]|uniref:Uncharacterized protein n=1 Tax=Actinomadura namibiensis TaxID=182080 RepID=A0A7W3QPA7_ACTNM|nr:hypothetical protein [Actinomadura namibiensis]MBA8953938.1 hypothetical protein [Actinomadura namibiensis]
MTSPADAVSATAVPSLASFGRVPAGGRPGCSPWPTRSCPHCNGSLDGGPTHFYCTPCGRGLPAADLPHETHRPLIRHQENQ